MLLVSDSYLGCFVDSNDRLLYKRSTQIADNSPKK